VSLDSQSLFNKSLRLGFVVASQTTGMTTGSQFLCPLGGGQRLPPTRNLRHSTFKLGVATVCPEIESRGRCPGRVRGEP
jgi:hypothetical protein